jgi:S-adenosylhomocysteine hydrolase
MSDVRQMEVHTVESLVSGSGHFEVEIAIAKLKTINCQVVIKFQQN